MSENEKPFGAHNAGLPPGWDFPEARAAAEEGIDIWLLDSNLKRTPWQRIQENFEFIAMANILREGLGKYDPNGGQ